MISGRRLALTTDTHSLSVTTGGTQTMSLDAGAAHGRAYLLLGSFSGIRPGIPLAPGVALPLNADAYMMLMFALPNQVIAGSFGTLDASGKATARFTLPPNVVPPPPALGLLLHHAYVVADANPLRFRVASNATPLTLTR